MPHQFRRRPLAFTAAALLALGGLAAVPQLASAAPDPGSPVKVNQVAYVPGLPKQATVVSSANAAVGWTLRNAAGATVASGQTTVRGADTLSGDSCTSSTSPSYDTPGTGYVLSVGGAQQLPVRHLRRPVRAAARATRWRSSTTSAAASRSTRSTSATSYARPAGHVNVAPNQGDNNVPCRRSCGYTPGRARRLVRRRRPGQVRRQRRHRRLAAAEHLRADAARAGGRRGRARRRHPAPSRSARNGVPDILDEARWELEFLLRDAGAGRPADAGMAHHKIHDAELDRPADAARRTTRSRASCTPPSAPPRR